MPNQTDKFNNFYTDLDSPAAHSYAITSSNTANTTHTTRSVYVGETGTLVVELAGMASGNTVTFTAIPAGTVLPLRVRKMWANSTANSVIGMY